MTREEAEKLTPGTRLSWKKASRGRDSFNGPRQFGKDVTFVDYLWGIGGKEILRDEQGMPVIDVETPKGIHSFSSAYFK